MEASTFDDRASRSSIGHFVYAVAEDSWCWSGSIYELYGCDGDTATTELLLRHTHADDVPRVLETLEKAVHDGLPFSCYHRIVNSAGQVRPVLLVGSGVRDDGNGVDRLDGFFVDLTGVPGPGVGADGGFSLQRRVQTEAVTA